MKTTIKIEDPENVELSMTITMPMSSWKKLNDQLSHADIRSAHPSWELSRDISKLVEQMRKHFSEELAQKDDSQE
jgi:uncharacterized membrane protein